MNSTKKKLRKTLKYIKLYESIYTDGKQEVNSFIKSFEEKDSELRIIIKNASDEIVLNRKNIEERRLEINRVYLNEVGSYMVDLETFEYKYFDLGANFLCKYVYTIKPEYIERIVDMVFKLDELIGKDAYDIRYSTISGSISFKTIELMSKGQLHPMDIIASFTFRKI